MNATITQEPETRSPETKVKHIVATHSFAGYQQNTLSLLGATIHVKVSSEQTEGAFCVVETTLPAHYRHVQPHWHAQKSEAFYVIDGALTFTIEDQTFIAQRGAFVLVPTNTVHVYWNSTASTVTFLTVSAPAGLEQYLAELAKAFDGKPYDAKMAIEIATRFDQFPPCE